jgi:hypothetical protein
MANVEAPQEFMEGIRVIASAIRLSKDQRWSGRVTQMQYLFYKSQFPEVSPLQFFYACNAWAEAVTSREIRVFPSWNELMLCLYERHDSSGKADRTRPRADLPEPVQFKPGQALDSRKPTVKALPYASTSERVIGERTPETTTTSLGRRAVERSEKAGLGANSPKPEGWESYDLNRIDNPEIRLAIQQQRDKQLPEGPRRICDKKHRLAMTRIMEGLLLRGMTTLVEYNRGKREEDYILPTVSFLVEHPQFFDHHHREPWAPPAKPS